MSGGGLMPPGVDVPPWLIPLISVALGGFGSILITATQLGWRAVRNHRRTKAAKFDAAITSDNLTEIGSYLREELGRVTVSAYLGDRETRSRLDRYVARIARFVAPPAEEPKGVEPEVPYPTVQLITLSPEAFAHVYREESRPQPDDPPAIRKALLRWSEGGYWDALAVLRRDLEKALKQKFDVDPASKERIPALVRRLDRADQKGFLDVWRTASRAIHGEDISSDDTLLTILKARELYRRLEIHSPNYRTNL